MALMRWQQGHLALRHGSGPMGRVASGPSVLTATNSLQGKEAGQAVQRADAGAVR